MSSKAISNSNLKLINTLKLYFNKFTSDKSLQNAVSKEVASMLQKYQPSVYGNEIVRNFDSSAVTANDLVKNNTSTKAKTDVKKSESSSIGNVINGISMKLKITKEEPAVPAITEVLPKWRTEAPTISRSSIQSRTTQIINNITTAGTDEGRIKHVSELGQHLQLYPDAKSAAIKEGAIRLLLRIEERTRSNLLVGAINEVFALLGHMKPLPNRGIRILSIDGGGVRGIAVIDMLHKLEELTGKRVYELFDYICGVSTGAILGCSLGAMQKSCDQLRKDYIDISTKVFTQSVIKGSSSLVWNHSYYNTQMWEQEMRGQMGEVSLLATNRIPKCPKIATVSAVVNHERVSAYVFRNYALPWRVQSQYMGSMDHKLWEATRASAAAPTYFEECKLGNLVHQDGGILVNNPTAVAIHEAKLLWPDSPIQCIVSFGTGRTVYNPNEADESTTTVTSWTNKFRTLLESATDTEGVHTMLSDLLPNNVYFRFNPYLTEMVGMTEIQPQKIETMERDVIMYLRRNEDKFQQAAESLMQPRTYLQKATDYLNKQREFLGLPSKL